MQIVGHYRDFFEENGRLFWLMDIRLVEFFHRIGRAASFYYDSTEKFEKNLLTLS